MLVFFIVSLVLGPLLTYIVVNNKENLKNESKSYKIKIVLYLYLSIFALGLLALLVIKLQGVTVSLEEALFVLSLFIFIIPIIECTPTVER